jgi:hypothetical protein
VGTALTADAVRLATVRSGVSLNFLLRHQAEERSRLAKLATGALVAIAASVLAQRAGTDLRAVFGIGRPDIVNDVIRALLTRPAPLA